MFMANFTIINLIDLETGSKNNSITFKRSIVMKVISQLNRKIKCGDKLQSYASFHNLKYAMT